MKYVIANEQLIFPAQINHLPEIRKFISRIAAKYQLSGNETNALTVSVDEACTNIIMHGYRNIETGTITINFQIKKDRLIVEIIDQGCSFDPNQVSDPNILSYVQCGKKGGLGIFLMKKLLDEIQYRTTQQVNILRLIKLRKINCLCQISMFICMLLRRIKEKLLPVNYEKKIEVTSVILIVLLSNFEKIFPI